MASRDEKVEALRGQLAGEVVTPGDRAFEEVRRVHNGMIDRRPALVVRFQGTADVQAAVRFARERGLEIAVRGGGHNVAGNAVCEGGLVVDLSAMRGVSVDRRTRRAIAQGGRRGATTTGRRSSTGSPARAEWYPPPASEGSRWAAGLAG